MIKVSECIADEYVTIKPGTPLKAILEIFKKQKFHQLPVVDGDGKLVGQVTLNEITEIFNPQPRGINKLLDTVPMLDDVPEAELCIECVTEELGLLLVASEIMTTDYVKISPDSSLNEAYHKMKQEDTKLLMVVGKDDKFVGLLGLFGIVYTLFEKQGIVD